MSLGKSNFDTKSHTEEKIEETEDNLWLEILNQVQTSSPKLPACKNILVCGDKESGKTSLIAKLQGNDDPKKGSGLEYNFLYVRDEYREDHTRLGIYVLDGDPWHRNLLKFVLNEKTFMDTTVLLTASMTQPWHLLESLESWAVILEEHVQRLKIPEEKLRAHKNRVAKRYQDYSEPGVEIDGVTPVCVKNPHGSTDANFTADIPINLGLDIIIVITKTDFMSNLEKEYDFKDEQFDFIQLTIRNFCLLYGCSLVYVSVKDDKNCDLLLKFILHRVFGFPFRTPALVVEKDALFIPAGWDNLNKTNILVENLSSIKPDNPFHEVISKPLLNRKPLQRETEIIAEDDQEFLCRLQSLINQQVPASVGRPVSSQETPIRGTPPGVQKTAERRISGSPGMQASPKKIDGKAGTVGGEGVLQNFFNSLLNRRTGSPIGPLTSARTPGADTRQVTARHEAELDRLSGRNKKTPSFSAEPSSNEDSTDNSSMKS